MSRRASLALLCACTAVTAQAPPLPSLADAVQQVLPAVVVVQAYAAPLEPPPGVPAPPPAPWRKLNSGAGLAVGVADRTVLLTCHHLIDGAARLLVSRHDGAAAETTLLAADPTSDLAVLACPWEDLAPATMATELPRAGDWVFGVGHPFEQYPYTVSVGLVSFVGRSFEVGERCYASMLQTDAATNRGSSGGPLCDLAGRVLGLQVAIYSPTGSNAGLAFAMPIATALRQAELLVVDGGLPYLGLTPRNLTAALASELRLTAVGGVVVRQVVPGGPAAAAGVLAGDRLIALDGEPVADLAALEAALWRKRIGDTAHLALDRRGNAVGLALVLGRRPEKVVGGR